MFDIMKEIHGFPMYAISVMRALDKFLTHLLEEGVMSEN